jgi:hypothetical protein
MGGGEDSLLIIRKWRGKFPRKSKCGKPVDHSLVIAMMNGAVSVMLEMKSMLRIPVSIFGSFQDSTKRRA